MVKLQRVGSTAGITSRLPGSLNLGKLLDCRGAEEGPDSLLNDLLDERLPSVDPLHQHFVVRKVKIPQNLERRSTSTSSSLDINNDRSQSPPNPNKNLDDATSAVWPRNTSKSSEGLNALLELPQLPQASRHTYQCGEALVDYSKSIQLTNEQYM